MKRSVLARFLMQKHSLWIFITLYRKVLVFFTCKAPKFDSAFKLTLQNFSILPIIRLTKLYSQGWIKNMLTGFTPYLNFTFFCYMTPKFDSVKALFRLFSKFTGISFL